MRRQLFLRLVSCAALTTAAAAGAGLTTAAEVATTYRSVLIGGVPHVRQKPDFCGEACAEMYLTKLGKAMDQDYVFDQAGVDPLLGRGCHTRELATALHRIGFRTGNVWYVVTASNAQQQLDSQFRALHKDLAAGVPSIICMRYDDQPNTTEHFRLILGYDARSDEVIFHEPAVNQGAYRRMKRDQLLALWPLKYDERRWTVVRLRLEPLRLADGRAASTLTDADYAQHIRQLKQELLELRDKQVLLKAERDAEIEAEKERQKLMEEEGEEYEPRTLTPRTIAEFQIVLQKPFVVIGDDSPSAVRRHAQGTVRWAVGRLKRDFFSQDPDHVINIWLFQNKSSYEQNAVDIFGRQPSTPFGYYSARDKALVMNIETGGGTLVHELVHPFVAANFPGCPSWLNEGLGSLYEQCQDRNGHIHGLTNWRLHGLHEALKDEEYEMPTFEELCSTSTREFYEEDPGTNYAQARYLLYYLQEQGLLVTFYHEFRRTAQDDPTGYATLCKVLGRKKEGMEAFQKEWTEYVLELRF
jgi:hypothetical protein